MRELRNDELAKLYSIAAKKGKDGLRTAIYARKSREDETQTSLSTQIEECRKLIDKYQLLTFDEMDMYKEDNVSGFNDDRQEFQNVMEMIRNKEIDVLVAMKSDRIIRNSRISEEILDTFMVSDAHLIMGDDFGDDSAVGILMRQFMFSLNEFQVRRTAEDVMKVHSKLVSDGKTVGMSNYGYQNVGRKFVQNPDEAQAVSLVYDMFLQGKSYSEISVELENRGYIPRKSKIFSNATINGILTNERNCGISIWNREENQHRGSNIIKQKFEEVRSTDVVVEPIISVEKFDIVQNLMNGRAKAQVNKVGKVYALSSLIKCNHCGGSMTGAKRIGGRTKIHYNNYECRNHSKRNGNTCPTKPIRADYIEQYLKEVISGIINRSLRLDGIDSEIVMMKRTELTNRVKRLKREINTHQERLDRLVLGFHESTNPNIKKSTEKQIDILTELIEASKSKLIEQQDSLEFLNSAIIKINNGEMTIDDIFINDITTRHIFQVFIKSIKVDNNDITIELNGDDE